MSFEAFMVWFIGAFIMVAVGVSWWLVQHPVVAFAIAKFVAAFIGVIFLPILVGVAAIKVWQTIHTTGKGEQ